MGRIPRSFQALGTEAEERMRVSFMKVAFICQLLAMVKFGFGKCEICKFEFTRVLNSTDAYECNESCLKDPKCKAWMVDNPFEVCRHRIQDENGRFSSDCIDTCEPCKTFTPDSKICKVDDVWNYSKNTMDECFRSCQNDPECINWQFMDTNTKACGLWMKKQDATRFSIIC